MNSDLLAKRFNDIQNRLIDTVMPQVDNTSTATRQHLVSALRNNKFSTKQFLTTRLHTPLSNIMVVGHIAGVEAVTKLAKQEKIIASHDLELSILSSAISFASRLKLNLPFLRDKYKTTAFQVISSASDDINKELSDTITRLIKEGAHINEAKEVLQHKFDQLGLRPASRGQLETIFRTQLQIAFAAGKYSAETRNPLIYRELWGYKYITTEDSRVRPQHAILDGVTLPKDDPFWDRFYPPNGWNCRCQVIPLFEEQPIVQPPAKYNGKPIAPDKGFDWKAGRIFNALAS